MQGAGRERILVMRLGAIGDCLRVLPAVQRLRKEKPDAHIGWAVEHWVHPVLAGNPLIDRFHILDRRELKGGFSRAWREMRRTAQEIRGEHYDVLIDFHGRFKSGVLSRMTGVPTRIGFARADNTEGNHLFMNLHVALEDHWENRVQRFLRLLAPLNVSTAYDPGALGLHVPPAARSQAQGWYEASGRPPLAAYPGTSLHREDERWPKDKWIELLKALTGRGLRAVLFWGPAEEAFTREIAEAVGDGAVLAPRTTLPEMLAMLGCFRAFVGSDTAAMHMAWMQGVPTAVFAGSKPLRTAQPPPPARARLLRPASYAGDESGTSRAPGEIVNSDSVENVLSAVENLLA